MLRPDFLIAGAPRCGTTALARYLVQHPHIAITEPKEPHFLAFGESGFAFTGPGDDETINRLGIGDLGAYQDLMREAAERAPIVGDGSVSSLYHAKTVADRLSSFGPGVTKAVVFLRNPVDRAYSSFLYQRKRGFEPFASFEKALDAEESRIETGFHHMWHYVAASQYSQYLPQLEVEFGADNVRPILFEHFEEKPLDVTAEITEFLGADSYQYVVEQPVNRSAEPRYYELAKAMRKLRSNPRTKDVLGTVVPRRVRRRVNEMMNSSYPELDDSTRASLAWLHQEELDYLEAAHPELEAARMWGRP